MSETGKIIWAGACFKGKAEAVYEELLTLGEYTPQMVVDYARSHPQSELYKCFDWNDESAAEKWRLHTARLISCSLSVSLVTYDEKKQPVKLDVRLMQSPENNGYAPVQLIVRNPDRYTQLLNEAKKQLAEFKKRFKEISELASLIDEIDRLIG